MPRWDVHISFGLMAFVTLVSGMVLGMKGSFTLDHLFAIFPIIGPVLLFGGSAVIIGSVLPDIDGRGKVRWIIGPVVGSMLFMPALFGTLSSGNLDSGISFIKGEGSLIFLAGTAVSYSSLIVPKKHRGIFHSPKTGVLFGIIWGAYVLYFAHIPMESAVLIGSMGALGYL
ncbi:MAG: hypothetical protein U9R75_08210, partial [Candidatus Thermoplasmatota archaeon]|nr:hypothetical protein [Candidatus Thermoplasmatota archaeon]